MRRRPPTWMLLLLCACGAPPSAAPPAAPPVARATAPRPPAPPDPLDLPTPTDPEVRVAKLPNGLTYYVLKHEKPARRAAFWLAVDAGSVLEDDDQRGLAHFVEHMAFNGTKRFPNLAVVDFIEKSGMKFGPDANAYTNADQTVYQLTVPTDDRTLMLQGLDVLRDMAGDVTFDPGAIDKERGVVLEEWRLGRGASARVFEQQRSVLYQGSRYADRLTIGLPEVIKSAPPAALVRFYKDWYRPDLMAIIAVGDFEPATISTEIEARFRDLVNPAKPRPRLHVPVPRDHAPAVTIATDPEARYTSVTVYHKLDRRSDRTKRDYRRDTVERLCHAMLGARLAELRDEPASPLVSATSGRRRLTRTADAIVRSATAKEGRLDEALRLLFREIARVEQHGFLASELARAKKNAVARAERSLRDRTKAPLRDLAAEIVRNFVEQEQMPGPRVELEWVHELTPAITLDEVNALAKTKSTERGRVIAISGPAGAKLLVEDEVRALASATLAAPVRPWKDPTLEEPLVPSAPTPGKVVATARNAAADATEWTLANGIRVVVKPTAFQSESIVVEGWQKGGTSVVSDADFAHARFADEIVGQSGAGKFSARNLSKALAGKSVSASVSIGELAQYVSANTRPEDLETMMQLVYLRLTAPRHDSTAFDVWKAKRLEAVRHREDSPDQRLAEEVTAIVTGDHPRRRPASVAVLEQVDREKAYSIFKDRLADFTDFTFVFVGNIDLAELQPLVETYLGSLPGNGRREKWKDIGIKHPTSTVIRTVTAGTEPKSRVKLSFEAPDSWSLDGSRDARILSLVLRIRLREVLREDMGGVYGVSVSASISREPTQRRHLAVEFGCDPANVDKLREAVFTEIRAVAKNGIAPEYLTKVTEQVRRQRQQELEDNAWWLNTLRSVYYYGDDYVKATDLDAIAARITSANVKAAARRFFDEKRYVLVVLRPPTSG